MLALKEKCPQKSCLYLGDTLHFPYGEKSPEEVTRCASEAVSLIQKKWAPKAIVVACNTISVTALPKLRELFPNLPIVGTVPAIKLAAKVTKNKKIGLLATNATVNHPYCKRLIEDFASDCQVFSRGDPDLVSFIESRYFDSSEEERIAAARPAVDFFAKNACDTIILGCTHFTHIAKEVEKAAGPSVKVIDSRDGVVKQALKVEENSIQNGQEGEIENLPADMTFFVTARPSKIQQSEYESLCKNVRIPYGGFLEA